MEIGSFVAEQAKLNNHNISCIFFIISMSGLRKHFFKGREALKIAFESNPQTCLAFPLTPHVCTERQRVCLYTRVHTHMHTHKLGDVGEDRKRYFSELSHDFGICQVLTLWGKPIDRRIGGSQGCISPLKFTCAKLSLAWESQFSIGFRLSMD